MEVANLFNKALVSGGEQNVFTVVCILAEPEEGCQRRYRCYCNDFVIKNIPKMVFMVPFAMQDLYRSVCFSVCKGLLWLSSQLIICTEKINIYINPFPNALTSKKAKNHEIGIYFVTNVIIALCCTLSQLCNSKYNFFQAKHTKY